MLNFGGVDFRPAGAVCGIPTRKRLAGRCSRKRNFRRCQDSFQSQLFFSGGRNGFICILYTICIYIYILYIYVHYIYYIYIGFREGYIKSNILIIVQSNNFPQLSNIKLCVVRRNLDRWIFFIAAGARHGYATWRKVEGGDGAVTWLVLLNNTQLVGSWDMIPLMALVDGFLPNPLKNMLVKLEHFPGR